MLNSNNVRASTLAVGRLHTLSLKCIDFDTLNKKIMVFFTLFHILNFLKSIINAMVENKSEHVRLFRDQCGGTCSK